MKIFIFHSDAQFHRLPFMHSSDAYCAFHHSPLLQIEIQKRQFLKNFLSPPYRTKQGGKTKHLLKNLHFLQEVGKVGAGFLL